jgi:hypothetical protein
MQIKDASRSDSETVREILLKKIDDLRDQGRQELYNLENILTKLMGVRTITTSLLDIDVDGQGPESYDRRIEHAAVSMVRTDTDVLNLV